MSCEFCKRFSGCPARKKNSLTYQDICTLKENTPFSEWQTPTQLAETYGYTKKHILRLIQEHHDRIASVCEERRYYILRCSFESFLQSR